MRITLLISFLLSTSILFAQNINSQTSSEKFKQERERELERQKGEYLKFKTQRESEYEKFKSEYETAFEKFKKNYGQFLDEEEDVINIMSSNDNIPLKPLPLRHRPQVESSAAKEIQRIDLDRKKLSKITSIEFLTSLTDSKDEVTQFKEGVEKLNEINEVFEATPETKKVDSISKLKEDTVTSAIAKKETIIPSGKPTNYKRISSPFGTRRHPINRRRSFHKGVDLTAPRMTPIQATADGVVTYAKGMGGYGNFIKINHQSGYKTAYAHLHSISTRLNAEVKKGDIIGYVGSSGRSTGNHLHYEVYYQDKLVDPSRTF